MPAEAFKVLSSKRSSSCLAHRSLASSSSVEKRHATIPSMDTTLSHLSDKDLLRDLLVLLAKDRENTAALLAHLAEVDSRRLYLSAAYPSMVVYCIEELHFSEDEAFKRIGVARTARSYPVVFAALAEGRLHVSGVLELRGYLTEENVDALVVAA